MRFGAQVNFKSFKQLEHNFSQLVLKTERQAIRESLNKAGTPMLKAVKERCPKQSGLLRKSLKKKIKTYKRSGYVMLFIGPDRKVVGEFEGKRRWPVKYAHLVEFKHRPFMRNGFDATKFESIRVYANSIKPAIRRIAKRVNKKTGF